MAGNKNIQAKLVFLGDMGTGKTSLVLRFVKGQFYDYQESTIGAAFFTQVLSLNEATIKFDIWDTAGQERYHSLAPMYYRGAAAAVVVYDLTSMASFERAKKWIQELKRQGNPNLIMVLVANKADLDTDREVENEVGEQYATENSLLFYEASAKSAQNVNELFHEIGTFPKMERPDNISYTSFELPAQIAKRVAIAAPLSPGGMKLQNGSEERRSRLFCCNA